MFKIKKQQALSATVVVIMLILCGVLASLFVFRGAVRVTDTSMKSVNSQANTLIEYDDTNMNNGKGPIGGSKNKYTITYDANGGKFSNGDAISKVVYEKGVPVSGMVTTPTREGYIYHSWNTKPDGSGDALDLTKIEKDTRIYAKYTPANYNYNVIYITESGTELGRDTARAPFDSVLEVIPKDFEGYTTPASMDVVFDSIAAKTITFVYQPTSYNIGYNLNGGLLGISNPEKYNIETPDFTLNNPERPGYTFTGWTGANGSTPDTTTVVAQGSIGDRTYTANWDANEYAYNIVYKSSTGAQIGTATVSNKFGTSAEITPKAFTGYSTPASQTVKWDSTSAKTITFTYPIIKYDITYTLNGGVMPTGVTNPSQYTIETNTFTLNNPTKTGYKFAGWTGANGATAQTTVKVNKGSSGLKNFVANWTANTYTIKFNANGGTGSMSNLTATYDTPTKLTANAFTRTDYTFLGWSTNKNATNAEYSDAASVTNLTSAGSTVTLYAVWHLSDKTVVSGWVVNDMDSGQSETSQTLTWDATLYDYALVTIKNARSYDYAGGSDWLCHNRTIINGTTYNAVAGTKTYEISLTGVDTLTVQLISSAWGGGLSGAYPIECVSVELKRYDGTTFMVNDLVDWSKWGTVWENTAEYTGKTYGTTYSSYVGVSMNDGESSSNTVKLTNGHKYYLNMFGGDYGDSNQSLRIIFSAFNIDTYPADCDARTSISQISTFTGATGQYTITVKPGATGNNISGLGTTLNQCDVIDLTATFGAGNEPTIQWCRENIYGISNKLVVYAP